MARRRGAWRRRFINSISEACCFHCCLCDSRPTHICLLCSYTSMIMFFPSDALRHNLGTATPVTSRRPDERRRRVCLFSLSRIIPSLFSFTRVYFKCSFAPTVARFRITRKETFETDHVTHAESCIVYSCPTNRWITSTSQFLPPK